jgi:hypothetical protein
MIWWVTLAGYLFGWLLAVRPAMRRRMLQQVCAACHHHDCLSALFTLFTFSTICVCYCADQRRVVRGAVAERTTRDAAAAAWLALWWPAWLAGALAVRLFTAFAHGVARVTPLTRPELERRIAEQQREIQRLTAQIGGES